MRIRGIVGTLAACSLLAGCGLFDRQGTSTQTPTPAVSTAAVTPTASATPAAPAPSATLSPTVTPSAASESAAADVFTYEGYGALRLGMTSGEGVLEGIVAPIPDDPCDAYEVSGPYAGQPLFPTFGEGDALVQVAANQPGPATWQGAQVGMTWGEVQQRHPDVTVVAKDGNGGPFYAAQVRNDSAMLLFMAAEEDDDDNLYGGTLMSHPNWDDSEEIDSIVLAPYNDGVFGGC
jgi:hypothetical protein